MDVGASHKTKPHLRNHLKMTVNKSIDKEIFDRTGLWMFLKLFHYYGFRLLKDPEHESCLNRRSAGTILIIACAIYATGSYYRSRDFIKNDGSLDYESVGFYVVMSFGLTLAIVVYALGLSRAKNYSVLFYCLASAIDNISDRERKERIHRGIKRIFTFCCIPYIVGGCALSLITTLYNYYWVINHTQELNACMMYFAVISMNTTWALTVGSFYLFINTLLPTVCWVINAVVNAYLEPEVNTESRRQDWWVHPNRLEMVRKEEMIRNMVNHKKMSLIVRKANSVFSHFLLLTLAFEITVCVAYVKILTMKDGTLSFGAYVTSPHILLLILKAFACADVNDKLKSSLRFNKLPNPNDFSNEQVSYLLYMEWQNINKAELTYGNIFPVTKTFIFTIAGTALTYALVLQGLDQ